MTHHETSAGLLNPVAAVGALARQHGLKLIVDATSSAGVEDLDVTRDGIDACITTSGKCLHAVPGLSLVCVRRDLLEMSRLIRPRSYSDLHRFHDQMEFNGQTPFTASVPLFLALDRALEEFSIGASMNDDASTGDAAKYWRREWYGWGYLCCRCHRGVKPLRF